MTLLAPRHQAFQQDASIVGRGSHAHINDAESAAQPHDQRGIRVLLADDHRILREGIASLLQEERDIVVVGEASDGAMAVEMAQRLRPDIVLMDITMPRMSGVEATRRIARAIPQTRIIALSMHNEADMAGAIRDAGAVAYLTKGGPSAALVAAIRAAIA